MKYNENQNQIKEQGGEAEATRAKGIDAGPIKKDKHISSNQARS